MRKISFSPPDITETEINEVIDALKSGWITTGPKTKELERKVAEFCHTTKAVCLNSNGACSELTLRLLGIGPGDEVILPAYTYTATACVVDHVGAKIVMIDCQKGKFTMDYDKLEAAVNEHTKIIVPVDIFGIPCDYDRIYKIVENKKHLFRPSENPIQQAIGRIIVMADAAHAFGASWHGKMVGEIADFTNFSFHAVKNLTTAEGGAVTWREIPGIDSEELYQHFMLYSLYGQSKDALHKSQLGSWEYDVAGLWYKFNMTDIHAAIGLGQFKRYDRILIRKHEMIEKYNTAFADLPVEVLRHYSRDYSSSGHLYVIRLINRDCIYRDEFIIKMAEQGIATNVHYKPLPMYTGYRALGFDIGDYPNAYEQYKNEVTLPLHTSMTDGDIEYIVENIRKILTL